MAIDREYLGVNEVVLTHDELAKIYETRTIDLPLFINEYLVVKDEDGEYIDRFRFDGEHLIHFKNNGIDNRYIQKLKPKNLKQQCLFDLLQNDNIPVKLVTGNMGSGKTFLTLHHSLDKVYKGKFNKIVYVRNNIDVKDTKDLGALPNGIKEKLLPYIMPLVDCIGGMQVLNDLEREEQIEYLHLGYARGRSFTKSIIICSEAENLTKEHVALLIGRVGEDSIIIFEGDLKQVDKKAFEKNNGILALKQVLGGHELFGHVHLDKSERSHVAELSSLF